MVCTICYTEADNDNTIKSLDLYIVGSEGTNLCFQCEMAVVEFLRGLQSLGSRSFLRGYTARKRVQERVNEA